LLGVFETHFATKTLRLRSGDKVLFHTDGFGTLPLEGTVPRSERLLSLMGRYRALPIQEFIERLVRDLRESSQLDELTLLGLEVGD
jgi:Stage II sporulation protein E (SpoIIE)